MVVRIRFKVGRTVSARRGKNRPLAHAGAALIAPVALMAYVLGIWRLASDLGFTGEFGLSGFYSHWQIWLAAGVALHVVATMLNRYGGGQEMRIPRALIPPMFRPQRPTRLVPERGIYDKPHPEAR